MTILDIGQQVLHGMAAVFIGAIAAVGGYVGVIVVLMASGVGGDVGAGIAMLSIPFVYGLLGFVAGRITGLFCARWWIALFACPGAYLVLPAIFNRPHWAAGSDTWRMYWETLQYCALFVLVPSLATTAIGAYVAARRRAALRELVVGSPSNEEDRDPTCAESSTQPTPPSDQTSL